MRSVFVRQNVLGTFAECSQNVRRMFAECSQTIKCVGIGSAIMNHSVGLLERYFAPHLNIMVSTDLNPLLIFAERAKVEGFSYPNLLILPKSKPSKNGLSAIYSILCGTIGGILPPLGIMELYRPVWTSPCEHFSKPNFNPSVCRIVWIVVLYLVSKNRRREIDILFHLFIYFIYLFI